MNNLFSYDIENWLHDCPPTLIDHLKKLCCLSNSQKSFYLRAKLIEQF